MIQKYRFLTKCSNLLKYYNNFGVIAITLKILLKMQIKITYLQKNWSFNDYEILECVTNPLAYQFKNLKYKSFIGLGQGP